MHFDADISLQQDIPDLIGFQKGIDVNREGHPLGLSTHDLLPEPHWIIRRGRHAAVYCFENMLPAKSTIVTLYIANCSDIPLNAPAASIPSPRLRTSSEKIMFLSSDWILPTSVVSRI